MHGYSPSAPLSTKGYSRASNVPHLTPTSAFLAHEAPRQLTFLRFHAKLGEKWSWKVLEERERERDDLMNVRSLWLSLFVFDVRDCHIIVYHLNPCVNHHVHHSTGRNEEMFSSS